MNEQQFSTLQVRLSDWADLELAAHALAQCLGVVAETTAYGAIKGIYWSVNPVSDALYAALRALVKAGILEESPEDDTIVRWNPSFTRPDA